MKFMLNISKDEQERRLQARLDNPEKRWKFSLSDLKERVETLRAPYSVWTWKLLKIERKRLYANSRAPELGAIPGFLP